MYRIPGTLIDSNAANATKIAAMRNAEPRRGPDEHIVWTSDSNLCGIVHLYLSMSKLTPVGPNAEKKVLNGKYLLLFIH
tara:strand:+ start:378 stop:614 length:237 start_codon:yes stop_codon:yes gene_type:complete